MRVRGVSAEDRVHSAPAHKSAYERKVSKNPKPRVSILLQGYLADMKRYLGSAWLQGYPAHKKTRDV